VYGDVCMVPAVSEGKVR